MSYGIPDDPIISCIERTGFPPWLRDDGETDDGPIAVYDPEQD